MPITIVKVRKLDDLKSLRSEADGIIVNGKKVIYLALEKGELKVLMRTNFGYLYIDVPTVASIPIDTVGFKDEGIIFPETSRGISYQKYPPFMGDFFDLKLAKEGEHYEKVLSEAQR